MEIYFQNSYLEKLYEGLPVTGKLRYSEDVIEKFRERVQLLESLDSTTDLYKFKSLHFEALKGDKKGIFSIRVNLKYRLEFGITKNKITLLEIILITNLSNHYR